MKLRDKVKQVETEVHRSNRKRIDLEMALRIELLEHRNFAILLKMIFGLMGIGFIITFFIWDWLLDKLQIKHQTGLMGWQIIFILMGVAYLIIAFYNKKEK